MPGCRTWTPSCWRVWAGRGGGGALRCGAGHWFGAACDRRVDWVAELGLFQYCDLGGLVLSGCHCTDPKLVLTVDLRPGMPMRTGAPLRPGSPLRAPLRGGPRPRPVLLRPGGPRPAGPRPVLPSGITVRPVRGGARPRAPPVRGRPFPRPGLQRPPAAADQGRPKFSYTPNLSAPR